MKMTADDPEADEMFLLAVKNHCDREIDAIVRKYAAIVPKRLTERLQDVIYDLRPAVPYEWVLGANEVPELFGDDAYDKFVKQHANNEVERKIIDTAGDGVPCEIEYTDAFGTVVGRWEYGKWDPDYPFTGSTSTNGQYKES